MQSQYARSPATHIRVNLQPSFLDAPIRPSCGDWACREANHTADKSGPHFRRHSSNLIAGGRGSFEIGHPLPPGDHPSPVAPWPAGKALARSCVLTVSLIFAKTADHSSERRLDEHPEGPQRPRDAWTCSVQVRSDRLLDGWGEPQARHPRTSLQGDRPNRSWIPGWTDSRSRCSVQPVRWRFTRWSPRSGPNRGYWPRCWRLWAFLRVTTRKPNKPRLRLEPTRPARSLTPDGTSEGTPNRHDAQEKPLPSQDRGHGPQMTMADVLRERLRLNPPDQQVVWNNCFTRQPSK